MIDLSKYDALILKEENKDKEVKRLTERYKTLNEITDKLTPHLGVHLKRMMELTDASNEIMELRDALAEDDEDSYSECSHALLNLATQICQERTIVHYFYAKILSLPYAGLFDTYEMASERFNHYWVRSDEISKADRVAILEADLQFPFGCIDAKEVRETAEGNLKKLRAK
jgi:hypothetical protein